MSTNRITSRFRLFFKMYCFRVRAVSSTEISNGMSMASKSCSPNSLLAASAIERAVQQPCAITTPMHFCPVGFRL